MGLFQQSLWSLLRLSRLSHVLITACRELQYTIFVCAPVTPSVVNSVEFRLLIQKAGSATPTDTRPRGPMSTGSLLRRKKSESNLSKYDRRKHKRGRSNLTATFPLNRVKLRFRPPSSLLIQTYLYSVTCICYWILQLQQQHAMCCSPQQCDLSHTFHEIQIKYLWTSQQSDRRIHLKLPIKTRT